MMDCPDCRSALRPRSPDTLTELVCVGCAAQFWLRGAQLVREGSSEAVEKPERATLPAARAKIRKRDD